MDHLAEILLQLFVLLLAAKIGDELFKRLGQPPVVGEILAGGHEKAPSRRTGKGPESALV